MIVKKGDRLDSAWNHSMQATILLYDKGNSLKETYPGKYRWVIEDCKLFTYAKKSKHFKLTELFVELLEGRFLHCSEVLELLSQKRISVPYEFHCSNCPHLTLRHGNKNSKASNSVNV